MQEACQPNTPSKHESRPKSGHGRRELGHGSRHPQPQLARTEDGDLPVNVVKDLDIEAYGHPSDHRVSGVNGTFLAVSSLACLHPH